MSIAITEQPNYAAYSIEELEDVLENIDKQAFPERYQAAKNESLLSGQRCHLRMLRIAPFKMSILLDLNGLSFIQ